MENKSEPSPQGPQPAPSVVSSSQAVGNSEQLFEHRQQLIPSSLPSNIGHPYQNLPVGPVSPYVSHGMTIICTLHWTASNFKQGAILPQITLIRGPMMDEYTGIHRHQ